MVEKNKSALVEYKKFLIKILKSKNDFLIHSEPKGFIIEYAAPSREKYTKTYRVRFIDYNRHKLKLNRLIISIEQFCTYSDFIITNKPIIMCRFDKLDKELLSAYRQLIKTISNGEHNRLFNAMPDKYIRAKKLDKFLNKDE